MKTPIFTGSGVAIITPFHTDGSVNYEAFSELIEYQLANSTDSIVVVGTTGEASTLNDEEHLDVIEFCAKQVNGRVPVVAGTGSNDTRHAVALSQGAKERGADALLQVTPYYNKTNDSGLISHFMAVIEGTGLPTILYNVPSRTGMNISIPVYRELANHPLVAGTKEASGDIAHIAKIAAACGDDLPIYSGNDDQIVPLMSLGGKGVISVIANIAPQQTHDIAASFLAGDVEKSRKLQLEWLPLINMLFCETNPIPIKEAVEMIGIAAGPCRLPLGSLSAANREKLASMVKEAGLAK